MADDQPYRGRRTVQYLNAATRRSSRPRGPIYRRLLQFSENVTCLVRDRTRCRCRQGSRYLARGRTFGIDVPPHGISVETQLPGHLANGHAVELGLLHCFPSGPLQKRRPPGCSGHRHCCHVFIDDDGGSDRSLRLPLPVIRGLVPAVHCGLQGTETGWDHLRKA